MSVAFVLVLTSALLMRRINGQAAQQVTYTYKIQNATDVVSAVTPISASIAFNNYACMYMCTVNSNCALAVFKSTSSNCSLYDSSAQARIISAADSVSYQKQINGSV